MPGDAIRGPEQACAGGLAATLLLPALWELVTAIIGSLDVQEAAHARLDRQAPLGRCVMPGDKEVDPLARQVRERSGCSPAWADRDPAHRRVHRHAEGNLPDECVRTDHAYLAAIEHEPFHSTVPSVTKIRLFRKQRVSRPLLRRDPAPGSRCAAASVPASC